MKSSFYALFLALIITSCARGKYAAFEKQYKERVQELSQQLAEQPPSSQLNTIPWKDKEWVPTVNLDIRKPNYVVIHHTAQNSLEQTINTFQSKARVVSSHYVIGRDGKIVQMVNDYARARHAGVGKWGNDNDLNSSSIGIEMDNNGRTDPWPEVQIDALMTLLHVLKNKYQIPQTNFIGHADLAPNRKNDPYRFPWKILAGEGFGYWFDSELVTPPIDFNPILALRIIGYDTRNLNTAIKAFKIHFIQENENDSSLNDFETKVLYNVFQKYL